MMKLCLYKTYKLNLRNTDNWYDTKEAFSNENIEPGANSYSRFFDVRPNFVGGYWPWEYIICNPTIKYLPFDSQIKGDGPCKFNSFRSSKCHKTFKNPNWFS